jgi:ferredoxin-NADP reductase
MPQEYKVKVKEIIERTPNAKSIRVKGEDFETFKAGQFMRVFLRPREMDNKDYTRWLSISSSPTETGYLEFTKKLTNSLFSVEIDKLKVEDELVIKYPFGKFTFEGEYEKIAFLSGGIGITPIRSMVKYIIDKNLNTDVYLLYANRRESDIAFKKDFDEMQKLYSKLKVEHVLSESDDRWRGRCGIINAQMIKECLPDYEERKFYICGPPGMVAAMKKIIKDDLQLSEDVIFTENFAGYE